MAQSQVLERTTDKRDCVVIVGAGFAGFNAAQGAVEPGG